MGYLLKKHWNEIWIKRGNTQRNNPFSLKVLDYVKIPGNLLDIGAGNGVDSNYFQNKGFNVTALDISEVALRKIEKNYPKIKTTASSVLDMEFEAEAFDVIYAHLSLHYFNDKETQAVFKNIYNMLSPGGIFFVKCKSVKDNLFGEGEKISENIYHKGHTRHFFSSKYMMDCLEKGNFHIENIAETSAFYHEMESHFIEGIARK